MPLAVRLTLRGYLFFFFFLSGQQLRHNTVLKQSTVYIGLTVNLVSQTLCVLEVMWDSP